jgi:RNA polymerase sigma-70 factor (ECF subfamily)
MIMHAGKTSPRVVGQDRRAASDGDVARALSAGEAWAAVETWRRFAPMVLTLAKRTLGSRSEAEDIGQDVFCCVYRKVRTLRWIALSRPQNHQIAAPSEWKLG